MNPVAQKFGNAKSNITQAMIYLEELAYKYYWSDLPLDIKKARAKAIEAKIDALRAVQAGLNADAVPWADDSFE